MDTLTYESKMEYKYFNVFSFYYRSEGYDGDYRIYVCDKIGIIASYSGPWRTLGILEKIINSDELNFDLQIVKAVLKADTDYFPVPLKFIHSTIIFY